MYEEVINKCNEFYNELIDYQWDIRGLRKGFWTKSCHVYIKIPMNLD